MAVSTDTDTDTDTDTREMRFETFPVEIIDYLAVFSDRQSFIRLLGVNTAFYKLFRRRICYFNLNKSVSNFIQSKEYREAILQRVESSYHQIHLNFTSNLEKNNFSIDPIDSVYEIISNWTDLLFLLGRINQIQSVDIGKYYPKDYKVHDANVINEALQYISMQNGSAQVQESPNLRLQKGIFRYVEKLSIFPFIPTIQSLTLSLSHSLRGIDSRYLVCSHLQKLVLSDIKLLTDVSMLGDIADLTLDNCHQLRDISCLNNNRRIAIIMCFQVTNYTNCFRSAKVILLKSPALSSMIDFSSYLQVQELTINGNYYSTKPCTPLTSLSPTLKRLSINSISHLPLRDFPTCAFSLHKLHLSDCPGIVSLEGCSRIPLLWLLRLRDLTTLTGLHADGVRQITIEDCSQIVDFSALKGIEKVSILNCKGLKTADCVRLSKSVTLSSFDLTGIGCLHNSEVRHLHLFNCYRLRSLLGGGNIPTIEITGDISAVESLTDLQQNEKIILNANITTFNPNWRIFLAKNYREDLSLDRTVYFRK